jgi:hypothetical protein
LVKNASASSRLWAMTPAAVFGDEQAVVQIVELDNRREAELAGLEDQVKAVLLGKNFSCSGRGGNGTASPLSFCTM